MLMLMISLPMLFVKVSLPIEKSKSMPITRKTALSLGVSATTRMNVNHLDRSPESKVQKVEKILLKQYAGSVWTR